jgi:nitrous oxidase accessory protein
MMRCIHIIVYLFLPGIIQATTLTVGAQSKLQSLKKAIELAHDGDTILLQSGIYHEGGITLTKAITLIGQGNPVLEGEHKYEILLISGKNISITGITFRNSGYSAMNDYASVKLIDCYNVHVEKNTILHSYFAIHVSNSSYTYIRNNRISGTPLSEQLTGNGIHLWKSDHAYIDNNFISGHRDGIYFEFVSLSLIRNNQSENNIRYGLHFMFSNDDSYMSNIFRNNGAGVAVMYSRHVNMNGNLFEQNWGPSAYGILLKDITDSRIIHNRFVRNTVGIHMEGSSRIEIEKNAFDQNGWAVKVQASCENNNLRQNNFTGNTFDVSTNGSISLNTFSGNYWDKYEGYDINKDGTGDVPYHPVSMYSMITEQNPGSLLLLHSFTVQLLDKAERMLPAITPENLADNSPRMKQNPL